MKLIAGVDEVGRGSLVGPVYAAAVILKKKIDKKLLKDSKSISSSRRKILCKYIKRNSTWAIGKASLKEIENTYNAAKNYGIKDVSLLYCVSNYPSKNSDFNLNNIKIMKKKFKWTN